MFERFTEKARRTIFFARYEATHRGSPTIEPEHLLLGLLREDKALTNRFTRGVAAVDSIRHQIDRHTTVNAKSSTPVDLPLSEASRRVLSNAVEEATALLHQHVGTEHLILGILREDESFAARLLTERGLALKLFRQILRNTVQEPIDLPQSPIQPEEQS